MPNSDLAAVLCTKIYRSVDASTYLSTYLSIYFSIYLYVCMCIHSYIYRFAYLLFAELSISFISVWLGSATWTNNQSRHISKPIGRQRHLQWNSECVLYMRVYIYMYVCMYIHIYRERYTYSIVQYDISQCETIQYSILYDNILYFAYDNMTQHNITWTSIA